MAVARTKPKSRKKAEELQTITCLKCGKEIDVKKLYGTDSTFFGKEAKVPYCKECIADLYQEYYDKYSKGRYANPERKAVERVCMALDIYYKDALFESAMKSWKKTPESSLMSLYIRNTRLSVNIHKTYDNTMREKYDKNKDKDAIVSIYTNDDAELDKRVKEGQRMFGTGFEREDYVFLYNEYMDWTSRHECNTKSQEELFKQICFTQLELFKANRAGRDTKTLNDTLIKQLDAAKLQPKQNAGDTTADNQTLGTLIDKWENTRPIPEIDDELKDVDKIGKYISTFFFGHLCKMIGIDNDYAREYEDYMKAYTVDKPEYTEDDADEAIYHAMFGGEIDDDG